MAIATLQTRISSFVDAEILTAETGKNWHWCSIGRFGLGSKAACRSQNRQHGRLTVPRTELAMPEAVGSDDSLAGSTL